jgi:hypothetical protein
MQVLNYKIEAIFVFLLKSIVYAPFGTVYLLLAGNQSDRCPTVDLAWTRYLYLKCVHVSKKKDRFQEENGTDTLY